jgi:transposase
MYSPDKPVITPEKLRALVGLRIELVDMRYNLKKHISGTRRMHCKDRVDNYMTFLQRNIDELTTDIISLVRQDKQLSHNAEIIASVPGVDQNVAAILAVDMPWLGKFETKKTAGPAGVAPYTKDSGMYIDGDRAIQRRELHNAAIYATQHNAKLKAFYDKQINDGKSPEEALVSGMFKLVVIINLLLKKGTKWVEDVAPAKPAVKKA